MMSWRPSRAYFQKQWKGEIRTYAQTRELVNPPGVEPHRHTIAIIDGVRIRAVLPVRRYWLPG